MLNRGGQSPEETRNLVIAMVLILAILFGFEAFYAGPERQRAIERAQIEEAQRQQADQQQQQDTDAGLPPPPATREEALQRTEAARVPIDTGSVDGSISLAGARIDDLNLRNYQRTIEDGSPEVALLSPMDAPHGSDAFFGWEDSSPQFYGVGANDIWQLAEGGTLTPDTPLVLNINTGDGLIVTRTISIDEDYLFTISDEVHNDSGAARRVRPFGTVRRQDKPEDYRQMGVVHQGLVGVFGPKMELHETRFEAADKHATKRQRGEVGVDQPIQQLQGQGGWLGITDHYWMTAIAVDTEHQISVSYDARVEDGATDYRAYYVGEWQDIPADGSITYTQKLFAGAKRVSLLKTYQEEQGIPFFDRAIDWGFLWFLTRPLFAMMDYFATTFGHFAIAILLSTVVIKILMFPLVYQSFTSMAKMRALAPKMKEIQERFAADKQRMQQEQMKLFQTEKVNPLAGCMPLLLQLPVFFALYKVLSVTIEMRHTPFVGWIQDLSARDPTSVFNVFGLLPFDPTMIPVIGSMLAIGAWPILNGLTMWALQGMSPPPTDPIQARIFQFLPIVYTIIFAGFAAGLVIYYTWSNVLTLLQQYVIMRRQGVETQFDIFIRKQMQRYRGDAPTPAAAGPTTDAAKSAIAKPKKAKSQPKPESNPESKPE